jgi:DNA-binding CsgD family transcriptional regulator
MNRKPNLEPKERQMLELLAQGASTRVIARKMTYSEGTVRVYLHNLYKKLGVKNRTEALLWQLEHGRSAPAVAMPARHAGARADDSFGDVALRDGLLATLGIMESFIGPYGRLWEVAARLKGAEPEAAASAARDDARMLWRALLQGSFTYAKALHDEGMGERLAEDASAEAVLFVSQLILGGYSNAADGYLAQLGRVRKGKTVSAREMALLRSLREAVYEKDEEALTTIHEIACEKSGNTLVKQLAAVLLFHAYRLRKDTARARETANALWAHAEESRRQLEAMGVRPFARDAVLPKPGKAVMKAAREKVTAGS